jgi:hypothetical protein
MTATATTITPALPTEPKRCRHNCPGGHQCGCDAGVRHVYHICNSSTCICHLVECYDLQANSPAQPQNESRTA